MSNSEQNIQNMILQAPIAMGLFVGPDMVLKVINDRFLTLWEKDRSIIGLPILTALPELEEQPYFTIMQEVFKTGITYEGKESVVNLWRNGHLELGFYNFTNQAFRDTDGNIIGVLVVAYEVTSEVKARHLAEERYEEQKIINEEIIASNKGSRSDIPAKTDRTQKPDNP